MERGGGIKTFNSAKKFAEEILHPLIRSHTEAKIRSRLGAVNDEEALKIPPKVRLMKRFNAMKERIIVQQTLLTEIEATVLLNGRKSEIELLGTLKEQLSLLEDNYDSRTEDLITKTNTGGLLTPLFKEMGEFLDRIYVQLQRIMTKNKLLFFGDDNEFLDNEELMQRIKNENRSA